MLVFTPNGRLTCYGSTLARLLARHTRAWHARGFFVGRKRQLRPPDGALPRSGVRVRYFLAHPAAVDGRDLGDIPDQHVDSGWVRSTRPGRAATSTKWRSAHGTGAEIYSDKTPAAPPWRAARRGV